MLFSRVKNLIKRIRWDSNPRYFINTIVFKTNALNHSTTYSKQKKGFEPSASILARLHSTIELHLQGGIYSLIGNLNDFNKKYNSWDFVTLLTIVISKEGNLLKY